MNKAKSKTPENKSGAAKPPARAASKPGAGGRAPSKAIAPKKTVGVDGHPPLRASDWREDTLARLRALILEAAPDMVEERKWIKPTNPAGVAAWSKDGLVATGEKYKGVAKITFAHGAALPDPLNLFNAGLNGGTRRAIDLREGARVDARAFKALIKAAVAYNQRPR